MRKSSGILVALALSILAGAKCATGQNTVDPNQLTSWHDLPPGESLVKGVDYHEFHVENGSTAHLIVCDLNQRSIRLKALVNDPTCSTTTSLSQLNRVVPIAGINAAFFNLSNGQSTSYVSVDGRTACDPHANPALMNNTKLQQYLPQILNRSELRILNTKDSKIKVSIAHHNAELPPGSTLVDAIQAGPQLLPELDDQEEAFVRRLPDGKQIDSIGVNLPAARTAIGIAPNNRVLLLCVSGNKQDEFSSGVTLSQLKQILAKLGCNQALNFDGGTSTTMVVRENAGTTAHLKQVCGRQPETRVKSVLAIVQDSH